MTAPWLWAAFTVVAAGGQALRNAARHDLAPRIGAANASFVRFLFGLPFALAFPPLACVMARASVHSSVAPAALRADGAENSLERTHMPGRVWIVAAIVASFAPTTQARAAGPGDEFLARVVGRRLSRGGQDFACFSRQYDDAHLAAHPAQRVTFVKALVDAYFRESWPGNGSYQYQVSFAFRFRDRAETLTGVAECGGGTPKDSLRGRAHCAGPGATSHLALQGRRVLVVTIPGGADLWAPGPKEQRHAAVKNPFGPDDEVFHLVRTELGECEDLAFDSQKPLRPHEP